MSNRNTSERPLFRFTLLALLALLAGPGTVAQADDEPYTAEELEEIVAPIALYPDIVLDSMLPASTAPTDVVQAARWVKEQDGEISEPPADSGWDPAVEAMVQFPDVLVWMSDNLDWMEMLAYAVAVQQGEVLVAIQDFREKAQDAGNLDSNEQVKVVQENEVIYIQPTQPDVVYVPTYDPVAVVRPGYAWQPSFWTGFAAGALGAWAWHGISWGGVGHHGSIDVNRNPTFNFNNNGNINTGNIGSGNRWNSGTRPNQRPSTRPGSTRPKQRPAQPGGGRRPAAGGVKPGGARPGANRPGSRPGGADRPTRPSTPPSRPGGNRPGADRPSRPSTPPSRPSTRPAGNRPSPSPSRPSTQRPKPGNKSMMGGSSTSGRTAKRNSDRGRSSRSTSPSRNRSSGGSSRARSRGGGSRGGGARGGGGRGGGGRRR